MTSQQLPGTDAARHGAGDADLAIMLAAHRAFPRDLTRLARAAVSGPARWSGSGARLVCVRPLRLM